MNKEPDGIPKPKRCGVFEQPFLFRLAPWKALLRSSGYTATTVEFVGKIRRHELRIPSGTLCGNTGASRNRFYGATPRSPFDGAGCATIS
jgi:hypothetical protein